MTQFQSTPSSRRETAGGIGVLPVHVISIHSLLAEGDKLNVLKHQIYNISIHSLLAEGDNQPATCKYTICISIHSLLAEGDPFIGDAKACA